MAKIASRPGIETMHSRCFEARVGSDLLPRDSFGRKPLVSNPLAMGIRLDVSASLHC